MEPLGDAARECSSADPETVQSEEDNAERVDGPASYAEILAELAATPRIYEDVCGLAASVPWKGQEALLDQLRRSLCGMSSRDSLQLQSLIVDTLRTLPLDGCVHALEGLLESEDFKNRGPVVMDGPLGNFLISTLSEIPEGWEHESLVHLLGEQMMRVQGRGFESDLEEILSLTPATERDRLEGRASSPIPDASLRSFYSAQLKRLDDPTRSEAWSDDAYYMLAAGEAEVGDIGIWRVMDMAARHPDPHIRVGAMLALSTVSESADIDVFAVQRASDASASVLDRVGAYLCLRQHGREQALPLAVREEILRLWKDSDLETVRGMLFD
ncbi:MAG: hypothetical protein HYY16_15390 [Planctomycetes bacterium]|nr:hypothetical protein [Planctomycetota bacterium]